MSALSWNTKSNITKMHGKQYIKTILFVSTFARTYRPRYKVSFHPSLTNMAKPAFEILLITFEHFF